MTQDADADVRVVGRTTGTGQAVYLVQASSGTAWLAIAGDGAQLTIRAATGGGDVNDQELTSRVRVAIALHNHPDVIISTEQDEDGVWCSQAILAPGVAAFGHGTTREEAASDCEDGLGLLLEELRGAVIPRSAAPGDAS